MPERCLYRNILGVTAYHTRGLRLIDYEDKEIEPFNEYVKLLEPESAIPITSEAKHQGKIQFVRISSALIVFFRVTPWNLNEN